MSRKRSRSDVANDSRKAVAVAGTRPKGGTSNSYGFWGGLPGKHDGPWRPGKTQKNRGRRHG